MSESDSKSFVEMDDKNKTNKLSMVCSLEDEESEMSDNDKLCDKPTYYRLKTGLPGKE